MFALKATILAGLVAIAAGHLCMMSPPQRGSFQGFNKAGDPDCALVKAPCGGRPASSNPILLKAGQSFRTVIQKNLDHFYSGNPGHFSVSFGTTSNMKLIGSIPDNTDPSLSLYALNVTIPNMPAGSYLFQTQYNSQNPNVGAVFYQCADVNIV